MNDIYQNVQLTVMAALSSLADLVAPEPEVRSVIQAGNAKVNAAKKDCLLLKAVCGQESLALKTTHKTERKALAEKQEGEVADMRQRHAATKAHAHAVVRDTRTQVISDISNIRAAHANNRQPAFLPG